jgi:hypothetical protein
MLLHMVVVDSFSVCYGFSIVGMHNIIYSPTLLLWIFGYQFLAVGNDAALNSCTCFSMNTCTQFCLTIHLGVELLDVCLCSVLIDTSWQFSQWLYGDTIPSSACEFQLLPIITNTKDCLAFHFIYSDITLLLEIIFLSDYWSLALFHVVPFGNFLFFFFRCPFNVFPHISTWLPIWN